MTSSQKKQSTAKVLNINLTKNPSKSNEIFLAKQHYTFESNSLVYSQILRSSFCNTLVLNHFLQFPEVIRTFPSLFHRFSLVFFSFFFLNRLIAYTGPLACRRAACVVVKEFIGPPRWPQLNLRSRLAR